MNNPKRYRLEDYDQLPFVDENGEFVRWEDYQALLAAYEANKYIDVLATVSTGKSLLAGVFSQFANSGWQPIETAPKDGTKVLVYDESYGLPQKAWFGKDHFKEEYEGWLFGDGDDYSCGLYFTPIEPTHWMPLPKPPTK